ncbi:MAG TPA: cation:proton antiporter [Stellaceae bacterium]|nr:cation:proton antiporter [Stellaceae bacterium]
MTFFESLLVLLAVAILLLQVSRRLAIPYPAMLAAAGVGLALIPGAPRIMLDPKTALALFIAPALVDAAFDFPAGAVWRLWRPLFALAVVAVVLTTIVVAWCGIALAGLPIYAAVALGAIVAPPDAAAAVAVLRTVRMPPNSVVVLKGESLLNDATALLLFGVAVSIQSHGGSNWSWALHLGLAVPGGVLLGVILAKLFRHVIPLVAGTLGGNLFEFVSAFGVWIIAERIGVSAVLTLVAFAMTISRAVGRIVHPRTRIHSFAVWTSAVFFLNVLAFLLMGLQARVIVEDMSPSRLREAARFAFLVVVCIVAARVAWVVLYDWLARRFRVLRGNYRPLTMAHSVLVGWCGMRGLVTLATSFALPPTFPQRDLIVLTAFAVVLATVIIQGLTLPPLIRILKLDAHDGSAAELAEARAELAKVALDALDGKTGTAADHLRYAFRAVQSSVATPPDPRPLEEKRKLGLAALRRQRERLEQLRAEYRIDPDNYLMLQEELDFQEVTLASEEERRIEES